MLVFPPRRGKVSQNRLKIQMQRGRELEFYAVKRKCLSRNVKNKGMKKAEMVVSLEYWISSEPHKHIHTLKDSSS